MCISNEVGAPSFALFEGREPQTFAATSFLRRREQLNEILLSTLGTKLQTVSCPTLRESSVGWGTLFRGDAWEIKGGAPGGASAST